MKKQLVHFVLFATIAVSVTACKNETQNKVTPTDAQETAVAGENSTTYEIDTQVSTINWRGTKPAGEHVGYISIESGSFTAIDNQVESGNILIDMNSLTVTDQGISEEDKTDLENHLKGTVDGQETDFFNVNQYPTASFELTGIVEENGQQKLQGNLTIKEDTKNIEFPVTTSIDGDVLKIESQTFTLDRTDWNVNYGSKSVFDNLGNNFISDDMEISISVEATKTE